MNRQRPQDLSDIETSRGDEVNSARSMMNALPHSIVMVDPQGVVCGANDTAQIFFQASAAMLGRQQLADLLPFGSPVLALIEQARERLAPVNEYKVDISNPRIGSDKLVDVYAAPVPDRPGCVTVMFQERTIADKMDRQLVHRDAARAVIGLAQMLGHEVKNPLFGIRGAAQLLESSVEEEDRALTSLITDETDRIVRLIDRMEVFSDQRPIEREAVNIHVVLDRVKQLTKAEYGDSILLVEEYDPSLPAVYANQDQLVQVFLNLVKNAAEALNDIVDPEIVLTTAFRPGIRMQVAGSQQRTSLPLEICVKDNGTGIPQELADCLFDPFITSKTNGSGLGLALVAKIIGDHSGVIEFDGSGRHTTFRVMLPTSEADLA
ncbi:PAS/PAC sensor signal transduction histidine kinase [Cohaesibacter gelatinilyticus]|uniref:histidine kinase n=2 Tax=Cohaesibacter gelatinilyticus TaxID=372072 RepID=A0A285NEK5_9HYPH|nr:PAS/PAC sensor signal transduction histidine kinase [Cohaesibacter gelatinilyticus]